MWFLFYFLNQGSLNEEYLTNQAYLDVSSSNVIYTTRVLPAISSKAEFDKNLLGKNL